ncbi:MAG TPA: hypothetical protein VMV69_19355 [Pirellulales bacterium]|nr:hypothetical protein [Pirellulales bacterium]
MTDERDRADLGSLARVFAALAVCQPAWDHGLRGWNMNMKTSPIFDEIRAEGRVEGRAEGIRDLVYRQGRQKFGTESELGLLNELAEVFLRAEDLEISEIEAAIAAPRQLLLDAAASPVAVAIANIAMHAARKEEVMLDVAPGDPIERAAGGATTIPLAERFGCPVETATALAIAGASAVAAAGQLQAVIGAILGASVGCSLAFKISR